MLNPRNLIVLTVSFLMINLFTLETSYSDEIKKYIECSSSFQSYHRNLSEPLKQSNVLHYRLNDADGWRHFSFTSENKVELSSFSTSQDIEVVHYTEMPLEENFFLIKTARLSGKENTYYPKTITVKYGDRLSKVVVAEFHKKFSKRFNKKKPEADLPISLYQGGHQNTDPVNYQIVLSYPDLFHARKGWHLIQKSTGERTFEDISTRNASAFPSEFIASEGENQQHILVSIIQRYMGSGFGCVTRESTIMPAHVELMVSFLELFGNEPPVVMKLEVTRGAGE
ncbi:hypothetical protein [Roseibium sp.]|uniref:hypothetical protein n=1 Tax=Roseibium sp. TaxID=1936156 RepID=UPI003BAFF556